MKIPPFHGPEHSNTRAQNILGQKPVVNSTVGPENGFEKVSKNNVRGAGIDSVTIAKRGKVQERAVYSMSELKGKADRALSAQKALQEQRADRPEPLADSRIGATRQELMELARLRINAGFYNRADVIEAISKRIIDNF